MIRIQFAELLPLVKLLVTAPAPTQAPVLAPAPVHFYILKKFKKIFKLFIFFRHPFLHYSTVTSLTPEISIKFVNSKK